MAFVLKSIFSENPYYLMPKKNNTYLCHLVVLPDGEIQSETVGKRNETTPVLPCRRREWRVLQAQATHRNLEPPGARTTGYHRENIHEVTFCVARYLIVLNLNI